LDHRSFWGGNYRFRIALGPFAELGFDPASANFVCGRGDSRAQQPQHRSGAPLIAERAGRRCIRGILVSLWMGFAFLVGQTFAWHELSLRCLHFNANPGSFFLYLVTGAHGLFVLGGMGLLSYVGFLIRRHTRTKWRAAMDSIALYSHFTDALWLYLVVLLFATIQDSSRSQGVVFPCLAIMS
jgi:hypothetical protein